MAEVIIRRAPGHSNVYCYDAPTNATEVNRTLHDLVRANGERVNIWVVSGTHGSAAGTVTRVFRQPDFKAEDLDSANRTSRLIHIKDYHLLAPNTWKELRDKPAATNVLVLAFCYSRQWFYNHGPDGNDGKL